MMAWRRCLPAAPGTRWLSSLLAIACVLLGLAPASLAQLAPAPSATDGPLFPVSRFELRYKAENRDLPPVESLLAEPVVLGRTSDGYAARREALPEAPVALPVGGGGEALPYHASAIGEIAREIVARLHERGLMGVYVVPHEQDVDLDTERDLRRAGDTVLRLVVAVGEVTELRSVAFGDRLPEDWRINHRVHRRIRDGSPIQPARVAEGEQSSLVDSRALEDYLFRLNRHPGRRVDAALAPAAEDGGISLDFQVTESRPWFVYAQTSDSGTEETNEWQTRIGVVHQQLLNRDDILSLEYLNAGFDDVNGLSFGYEAPWFSSTRPRALRGSERGRDGGWRSKIPWIGSDSLRWRVSGAWTRTLADDVPPEFSGFKSIDDFESHDWEAGGEFAYNAFQYRNFFVDLYAGLRWRSIDADNQSTGTTGREQLLLPGGGLRMQRDNDYSSLYLDVGIEAQVRDLGSDVDELGRLDADDEFKRLSFAASASHFLEPLFNRRAWSDPSTPGSSTLAHELQFDASGQYAFGDRLIPQVSQVIGGLYTVRGYPQSLAVGDSVAVGSLEYRFHLARSLPIGQAALRLPNGGSFRLVPRHSYGRPDWDLVIAAFFDAGRTWRNDPPRNTEEQDDTLLGAGIGVELQLGGHLRARVDWARALHSAGPLDDRTEKGDDEFHFLFSISY